MRVPSIYLLGFALLLLCGYTAAIAVMSVDLGSEWMKVAVVSPGVPMEIALNPASKRKTAVAVSIKDGERMFGADALVQGVKSPRHCYKYLLDLLGKKFDHPLVARFQSQYPFYTLEADPVRGTVLFKHDDETMYSPEELLGMILNHAKGQAEAFTEQKVKDVVITAPIYFNQAERQALVAAAQLGGLNVLQLINVPSAVALNYGMFRRKEINGTVKNLMFYDMGAQDTTAVVVGFQIVKTKERGFTETHPQAQILGVGYDRTLGGTEISLRLRKYLADEFNKMGKTKTDVTTVPRAMAKLYKEADRVKTILSANTDFYAQIENVMEDIDFKHQVTRDKLLELCSDMMERVTGPVDNALKTAAMSIDEIDQLIVVGGGTRVPKVQELLVNTFKKELGKNLNADEAAAMGAVYKAADLSTGFKVKKFITKDAVVFPIDVDFEREYETEAGEKGVKKVKRTLFSKMNPYPQKKIMTFNKHVKDFKFNVFYEDLAYLGEAEASYVGSNNVSTVEVKGVAEALEKNKGDNVETKGVKAHFFLDDSGILSCTTIESVFEKTISPEEQEKAEKEGKKDDDSWAKLGSTISQFFSGDKKEGEEGKGEEEAEGKDTKKENDDKKDNDKEKKPKGEKYDSKEGAPKKDKKEDEKKKEEEKKDKEPKKPKIETVKEELSQDLKRVDTIILEGDSFEASKKKLEDLDKADQERHEHETALNELQSFVYDMQDKLYMEEYESASTEEEKEKIKTLCSETSDWLDEEAGPFTPTQEFKDKLKALKELTSALFARVREHSERPEALQALANTLNSSAVFLEKSRNLTGDGDDGYFKEKELDILAKKIAEVGKWRDDKVEEQKATSLAEMPKLTVNMIISKITDLDSEVKFLVSTAKMRKAEKEREKRKKEAEEKKAEEEAKKKAKKEKKEKEKSKIIEEGSEETKTKEESEDTTKPEETGDSKQTETPTEEKPVDADTSATEDETEKSEKSETPEKSADELPTEEEEDASETDQTKTEL